MGGLILQTLLGSAGGIISAVVGYILTRQLRRLFDANAETDRKAVNAETAAAGASTAAGETQEQIKSLTRALSHALGQIDDMARRHDDLWARLLTKETYDLRLKRIEQYLLEHETAVALGRTPTQAVDIFTTGNLPTRQGTR